jgi:hypothetical protein
MLVGSATLWVSYHQFWLLSDGADTDPLAEPGPLSFVELRPDAAMVRTGLSMGSIAVTVAQLDEPPTSIDSSADWADVVEFSFTDEAVPPIVVVALEADPEPGVPDVSLDDSEQSLRVRVHAIGRDAGATYEPADSTEAYLIQVWQAMPAAAETLRANSTRAGTGIWVVR